MQGSRRSHCTEAYATVKRSPKGSLGEATPDCEDEPGLACLPSTVLTGGSASWKHSGSSSDSSGCPTGVLLSLPGSDVVQRPASGATSSPPDPGRLKPALLTLCSAQNQFFEPCRTHSRVKKNECNFFWMSEDLTRTAVCCRHCDRVTGVEPSGSLLQVRRYMHQNVVLYDDISKEHDCRDIQSYSINQKRALLLQPKWQNATSTFDTYCSTCQVPLRADCSFCSLYCELTASKDVLDTLVRKAPASSKRKRPSPAKRKGGSSSGSGSGSGSDDTSFAADVPLTAKLAKRVGRRPSRAWSRKLEQPQRAPDW